MEGDGSKPPDRTEVVSWGGRAVSRAPLNKMNALISCDELSLEACGGFYTITVLIVSSQFTELWLRKVQTIGNTVCFQLLVIRNGLFNAFTLSS